MYTKMSQGKVETPPIATGSPSETARALLSRLIDEARSGGLLVRWADDSVVVIGLPPETSASGAESAAD